MKRLLKVTSFTALLTLLKMAIGFVISKVVAIHTGPSGMAMLGQLQGIALVLMGITNSPVGAGIVRYTAEYSSQGLGACAPWWKASLQWSMALLFIVIPCGYFFSDALSIWLFDDPDYAWLIAVIVFTLPFASCGALINSVLNGLQQYRRFIVLGMISALLSGVIMITLIIQRNLNGALLAASLQAGLIGIVMLIGCIRQPWFKLRFWWGKTEQKNKKLIGGYVLMALTTAITVPVSLIIVRNILVTHVGWEQAGLWQSVWRISEVYLGVITMALGTYYLPKLSSLVGVEAIQREISKTAKVALPIVIFLALLVYFMRDIAISLLFTAEFSEARNLFAIQLIGDVLKIAAWLYAYPMISRGATTWYITTEISFSILFVLFAWVFIQEYGTQGANIAYLISYILYFLVMFFNVKRFSK
jgi:PST family polysaccharide transporter